MTIPIDDRRELGRRGEDLATTTLQLSGMEIIERNWRCRAGEIDIVARDRDVLVFVEVKCRRGLGFGDPLESITHEKLRRLRRLAGQWLADHDQIAAHIRIDAVGIVWGREQVPHVTHVPGIG